MFCPKCATQNVDGASFCRSCGANISLVTHALSGQLPMAQADDDLDRGSRRRRRKRPPTIDAGIRNLTMGIAFVVISILVGMYSPGGWTWWYWLLIPASTFIGRGISDIIRARQAGAGAAGRQDGVSLPPVSDFPPNTYTAPARQVQSGAPRTAELMPPAPSVTEGTTRHLGAEAPTQHFDSLGSGEKPS
ncbi:MAG TPA: zinc ribbon domain-containing protein [Pyrinomonadaceae bacterium]|nr:zinc ribbon domain-containing protein [Pyrinomonadaceae bacterium]